MISSEMFLPTSEAILPSPTNCLIMNQQMANIQINPWNLGRSIYLEDATLEINKSVICVLTLDPTTQLVRVEYEPIERDLDGAFKELGKLFDNPEINAKSIVCHIRDHPTLKVLFSAFDYCRDLDRPFQGISGSLEQIEKRYHSDFPESEYKSESLKREKEVLLSDCKERLLAYYLERSYEKCEIQIQSNSILAYSHRKVGWSTPTYQLNKNFSIELKTNFGYGGVSYFYTKLKYKGLDIIPFSEWVFYANAQLYEIIRYSAQHGLVNESWKEALAYVCDACNLSQTNEAAFVRKYIVDQCEALVHGLENFLREDKVTLRDWRRIYTDHHFADYQTTDVEKEGHSMVELRGEKLSGALAFIQNITQFGGVVNIVDYVNRIENCNRLVQPMLTKEIVLIEQELSPLQACLDVLKPIMLELDKKHAEYEILRTQFRVNFFEKEKEKNRNSEPHDLKEQFEKYFRASNPDYPAFFQIYEEKSKECLHLVIQISVLTKLKNNIDTYNREISSYFQRTKK